MSDINKYNLEDLRYWSDLIEKTARAMGINFYPQEFEIIDNKTMLARKIYAGMLSFYPNISSGRRYEIDSISYELGMEYLPYEMVVAANPCLAVLRDDNDLAMQILTMAHVYGHNNFFKNNIYFKRYAKPSLVMDFFHSSAERIRSYESNPSIGPTAVRICIEAAHGLRWQCAEVLPKSDPFDLSKPDANKDLLAFLRDNSQRHIADWEKYIINTVITAFNYLAKPNLKTMGMNEGWATYCHYKIMNALKLPPDLRGAFARHHSKVVRLPDNPTSYNHYLVNFTIWNNIEKSMLSGENLSVDQRIMPIPKKLFDIMKRGDDISFLQEYLTKETAKELGLFSHRIAENHIVADRVIEGEEEDINFEEIKSNLIEKIEDSGFGGIPVITVSSISPGENNRLYLKHAFNGRYLEPEYASKTLEYIYYFWGRPVVLETRSHAERLPYIYEYDGKAHTNSRKS